MFENNTYKFDQHFLVDKEVIKQFLTAANITKKDVSSK